jgi:hypothetical protein
MKYLILVFILTCISCRKEPVAEIEKKVGLEVTEADLQYYINDKYEGEHTEEFEKLAMDDLAGKARFVRAALDAGLDEDPVVRAEVARVLISRLRETQLFPKLKEAASTPVPEARLREIYESGGDRYTSAEKRQVAVLWLDPGQDLERAKTYAEKLEGASEWLLKNEIPVEQGFGVLSIDHSEHAPSRYKGGVVGWFPQDGGSTSWEKAVVGIVYGMTDVGGVSGVIKNADGIFLVRHMGITPSKERSFEDVRAELEREERGRINAEIEAAFKNGIENRYR